MSLLKAKKNENLSYIDSLEDLSAYSWSKLQEENDVNWLRDGFNGRQPKIKDPKLDEIRKQLEDECFKLMNNDNFNDVLNKRMLIYDYAEKYDVVKAILQRMYLGFGDNQMESRLIFINKLKALKFNMPVLNSVEGDRIEIERLFQQVEGYKTKIKLLVDEIQTEGSKTTRSLNKEMSIVEQILGLSYMLDSKIISQAKWIELQKMAHEKNEIAKRKE